jgi:hypothetical protein
VTAFGAESSFIKNFDEFADIPGSGKWIDNGLDNSGVVFEIDSAKAVTTMPNQRLEHVDFDIGSTDVDLVTTDFVVNVKGEDFRGAPAARLGEQTARLRAKLQAYIDFAAQRGKQAAFRHKHPLPDKIEEMLDSLGDTITRIP